MELIVNTEDKTIEIKTDKSTTAEDLIRNIKHTLKARLDDFKIKKIK